MADDPSDHDSHNPIGDDRNGGGLASFVSQALQSTPERPSPDHEYVPLSVVIPGFLVVLVVVVGVFAALFDDAETLSDVSAAGRLTFVLLPLLFLVFLPWFGLALVAYSRRLESDNRRATMRVGGIAALVVGALPWVFIGVSMIVASLSEPRP